MEVTGWIQILSTIIFAATLPFNVRIVLVLYSEEATKSLGPSLRIVQLNIACLNALHSLIQLLVHDLAWYGVASSFIKENLAFAVIDCSKSVIFLFGTAAFHLIITLNQLTSVVFPFRHQQLWQYNRLILACVLAWILGCLTTIPFIISIPTPMLCLFVCTLSIQFISVISIALLIGWYRRTARRDAASVQRCVRKAAKMAAFISTGTLIVWFLGIFVREKDEREKKRRFDGRKY